LKHFPENIVLAYERSPKTFFDTALA